MGKKWDYDVPSVDVWRECLRVLKPGGHLLSFAGTRTQHRMAVNIEDAGFEIRDMIAWVYGSGFPKSLNVGKAVNSLETNEWSKIGKALDNIDQKSIMDVWKTNAKPAGIQLSKSLTEVGSNTPKKFFVPDIAVLFTNQKNEPLNAIIAELKSCGLNPISEESIIIVQESAEQKTELSPSHARYAVKLSQSQKAKHFNIFTAQCNVKEWLKENIMVNHRAGEALKTLRGNKKYSNEEITNVLCAELTDILKLTILNQSKTFQNLDTNQKTECASAINVIITEYTAENLISNTVDILKSKAVDKLQGNEREIFKVNPFPDGGIRKKFGVRNDNIYQRGDSGKLTDTDNGLIEITKGTSEFEGWGTALKPALEPITVARKPLEKGLTVAENCLKWGTGGINIDGCRVELNGENPPSGSAKRVFASNQFTEEKVYGENKVTSPQGRFPANLIHDGSQEVLELFPNSKSTNSIRHNNKTIGGNGKYQGGVGMDTFGHADSGSAARFFYCAKASKAERNRGCEGLPVKTATELTGRKEGSKGLSGSEEHGNSTNPYANGGSVLPRANYHPTVKPIALMEYLVKLVSREGQTVLDPFAGSGTTGIACKNLNRNAILIEREAEYVEIAKARIDYVKNQMKSSKNTVNIFFRKEDEL